MFMPYFIKTLNTDNFVTLIVPLCVRWRTKKEILCKIKNKKDKGLLGKIVEFYIFGNLPNSNSSPDTKLGDIKTTNLKKLKNGSLNAKERLTLTNFGNPFSEEILDEIVTKKSINETKYFKKISKGVIIVGIHDSSLKNSFEELLQKKIIGFISYSFENFDNEDLIKINYDFEKIKECLIEGKPTQSGQKYLHIHRHSSGGEDKTRAFGFTNKFLTKTNVDPNNTNAPIELIIAESTLKGKSATTIIPPKERMKKTSPFLNPLKLMAYNKKMNENSNIIS
jgi:hypothetical protein